MSDAGALAYKLDWQCNDVERLEGRITRCTDLLVTAREACRVLRTMGDRPTLARFIEVCEERNELRAELSGIRLREGEYPNV